MTKREKFAISYEPGVQAGSDSRTCPGPPTSNVTLTFRLRRAADAESKVSS
jgi:hypothetical protein